jgi:hypothetical protein
MISLLLLSFGVPGGCPGAYFLVDPEKTETVKADYGKIGDRKMAVLVWADRSTLDEYSQAGRQVCRAVTYYMKKNLPKAQFVSPREVAALQDGSGLDWQSMSNQEIGKELKCDLLLRLDLLEFTTRASDTVELRRARISATVNVYDCSPDRGLDAVYEKEIRITHPLGSLPAVADMSEEDLLHDAVERFAEETARCFYDHEVKLKGRRQW